MLRILAPQFLFEFRIGFTPETRQALGDLRSRCSISKIGKSSFRIASFKRELTAEAPSDTEKEEEKISLRTLRGE